MKRPVAWVGSSRKDYAKFPERVQDDIGYRLYRVQTGSSVYPPARPLNQGVLKGLGIYELGADYDGDTFRAVYTIQLDGLVYVLHAFKKKSRSGIATPQHDIDLIRSRYLDALQAHAQLLAAHGATARNKTRNQ
ncbi:MAG TPA: type II toxin-antitoxin system RelE/ParE family toxin [Longimicrobium sp.]